MITLDEIEWSHEPLLPPTPLDPLVEEAVKKVFGYVPTAAPYVVPVPWVAQVFAELASCPVAYLPADLGPLVELVVAQDHACRYCYGWTRTYLKLLGYKEEYVRKLEHDLYTADLSDGEKAALEFARKLSRYSPRPTAADIDALQRLGFSRSAVAELAFLATRHCYTVRIATPLAIPPDSIEAMERNVVARILRPLTSRRMRKFPVKRKPEPFPADNTGPYAGIVSALEGAPTAASTLRKILDDAWQSPIIPKRAKGLIFAVIARSLGCQACEMEARRLLQLEGFSSAELDEILSSLASAKLDPFESRLVPFARETVHYQTGQLQKKCREFSAGLKDEELLEVLGTAALANCVSRLEFLLNGR